MLERQRERDKRRKVEKIEGGERVWEWADQGKAEGEFQSIQEERGLGRKRGEERGKMGRKR